MEHNSESVVAGLRPIQITGAVVLICGLAQIGVDIAVFVGVNEIYLGAWWAGVIGVLIGLFTLICTRTKSMLLASCMGSFVAILAGIVACFYDGIGYGVINGLSACAHGPNTRASAMQYPGIGVTLSGESSHYEAAYDCYADYIGKGKDCVCVSGSSSTCYFFSGNVPADSCELLFTTYNDTLKGSIVVDVVLTVSMIGLSIVLCTSLMCPTVLGEYQFGSAPEQEEIHAFEQVVSMRPSSMSNRFNANERAPAQPIGRGESYRDLSPNRNNSFHRPLSASINDDRFSPQRSTSMNSNIMNNSGQFSPQRMPSFKRQQSNPVFSAEDYDVTEVQL